MQCDGLDLEDPDLQARWSTLYGIKNRCILNDLRGFHVIGGCVSDLMHDTLEGILSVTICALLECCIFKKKYFTLGQLNNILANFQYVKVEARDKPSKIEPLHLKFSVKKTKRTLNLKNRTKNLNSLLLSCGFLELICLEWLVLIFQKMILRGLVLPHF
jgi:hypothetical protein